MERKLGLCEGCRVLHEYLQDATNYKFNEKCYELMVETYKGEYQSIEDIASKAKEQSKENVKRVYEAARGLKNLKEVDDDEVGLTVLAENKYYIIKNTELFFEKDFERTKMCASMLYQLLLGIDERCGIEEEVREVICRKLEKHFYRNDTDFFAVLDRRLHGEQHFTVAIDHLLEATWKPTDDAEEELLFTKKALWLVVYEVCLNKKLAADNREGFVRDILRYVEEGKIHYHDEARQKISSGSIREAASEREGRTGRQDYHRADKIREVLTGYLREYGNPLPRFKDTTKGTE